MEFFNSEIEVVSEADSVCLGVNWSCNQTSVRNLYFDRIFTMENVNLLKICQRYLAGCLYCPSSPEKYDKASSFLSFLSSGNLVCQAFDDLGNDVFLLLYCQVPFCNGFMMLKISLNDFCSDF